MPTRPNPSRPPAIGSAEVARLDEPSSSDAPERRGLAPADRQHRSGRLTTPFASLLVLVALVVASALVVTNATAGAAPAPSRPKPAVGWQALVRRDASDPAPTVTSTPSAGTDPHEIAAQHEAVALSAYVPDPAWSEVTTAPAAALDQAGIEPGTTQRVTKTRFWVAAASWSAVMAVVDKTPAGMTPSGSGSTGDRTGVTTRFVAYTVPAGPGLSAGLVITTAPASAGHIGVRVDAEVTWTATRAPAEFASAKVDSAVVSVWQNGRRAWVRRVFTDAPTVRKLRRAFNALSVADTSVALPCVADFGLRFGLRLTGPGLPTIIANAGLPCGQVQVIVGGKTMPVLSGGSLTDTEANTVLTTVEALNRLAMIIDTQPVGTPIHD